ncbi:helix-turn-helix domain-containing protein [Streptomyces shenzhenensis]|uniref:helix-turn-helix domain-containing protein n=1 Tax=Streptomyces shenzhenensis TaxID=943815 RepID=UPI0015F04B4A|nr:helix-turn-helix domain-containing protein [Streptomyces shenzhenensis]
MSRREIEIDPTAGPVERFAWELRKLRAAAGAPGYRQLAARAHYSASALSTAASGKTLPTREVTLAFVAACGGDVEEWAGKWAAAAELAAFKGRAGAGSGLSGSPQDVESGRSGAEQGLARHPSGRSSTAEAAGSGAAPKQGRPHLPDASPALRTGSVGGATAPVSAAPPGQAYRPESRRRSASPGRRRRHRLVTGVMAAGAVAATVLLAAAPAPAPTAWTATAGDDCPHDGTRGVTMNQGGADGGSGWTLAVGGDWRGDGCRGDYRYTAATGDDLPGHDGFVWWFRPQRLRTGGCSVRLHIPQADTWYAGGRPAYYTVRSGAGGMVVGAFTIDQVRHHGQWVDAGRFRLTDGQLSVRLSDRGSTRDNVAAGALSVRCTGAGTPVPSVPASLAADGRAPAATVTAPPKHSFDTGGGSDDGWSPMWGDIKVAVTALHSFDGQHALAVTATGRKEYSAVGTPDGARNLHTGSTVAFHLWTDGQCGTGAVQPLVQDAGYTVHPAAAESPLPCHPGWTTLDWTVPPVSSVHAVGLQITTHGRPVHVLLDGVHW